MPAPEKTISLPLADGRSAEVYLVRFPDGHVEPRLLEQLTKLPPALRASAEFVKPPEK